MASQAEIEALETAINSGVRSVKIGDRQVNYNSTAQMEAILAKMKAQLAGTPRTRFTKVAIGHLK